MTRRKTLRKNAESLRVMGLSLLGSPSAQRAGDGGIDSVRREVILIGNKASKSGHCRYD